MQLASVHLLETTLADTFVGLQTSAMQTSFITLDFAMLLARLITEILSHVHPCRCNEKADIFSYGVVLWEIITQEPPRRGHLRDLKVRSCSQHTMCPAQKIVLLAGCCCCTHYATRLMQP